MLRPWLPYLALVLLGFASGSVMYAYYLPKLLKGVDVRAVSDDGNPGGANAIKYGGPAVGALSLTLDILKGVWPVLIGVLILDRESPLFSLVIAAPVAGHAFSPLMKWKGGKAIAVSFGALLGLLPFSKIVFLLAGLYVFFSLIVVLRPNRWRTVVTFGLFGLLTPLFTRVVSVFIGVALVSGLVLYRNVRLKRDTVRSLRFLGHDFGSSHGEEDTRLPRKR